MNARTFTGLMLLLVFAGVLLAFSGSKAEQPVSNDMPTENCCDDTPAKVQVSDGTAMWEAVSRHLMSAIQ